MCLGCSPWRLHLKKTQQKSEIEPKVCILFLYCLVVVLHIGRLTQIVLLLQDTLIFVYCELKASAFPANWDSFLSSELLPPDCRLCCHRIQRRARGLAVLHKSLFLFTIRHRPTVSKPQSSEQITWKTLFTRWQQQVKLSFYCHFYWEDVFDLKIPYGHYT